MVTRDISLHQYYKKYLEDIGYTNISVTAVERDGLRMMIEDMQPCLVMVEADFYDRSTPYMLSRLLDDIPSLNIAAVNVHKFPEKKAVRFITNGVKSYVNKYEGMEEFHRGLKLVKDGKKYVSPNIREMINSLDEKPEPVGRITERENEVLDSLCRGSKEEEIAKNLEISVRTVFKHKEHIYKSLDVENSLELLWAALSAGLFSFEEEYHPPKGNDIHQQGGKSVRKYRKRKVA